MYLHNCITKWIGDGSFLNEFRPSFNARSPNGNYGEPADQVCHTEFKTTDPTALEADVGVLILHSTNDDGSPRLDMSALLTAGQRNAIVTWLQNHGVTTQQLTWLQNKFEETFGHPWNQATRGEAAKVIRYAINRRFQ